MIRFDARAFHMALDLKRLERGQTWAHVAIATGVSAATLRRTEARK